MPRPLPVSASLEDYLEAIDALILSHGHAHAADIAAALSVKPPSVTKALDSLAAKGHLRYVKGRPVTLTPSGRRIARDVRRRHLILEAFFRDILGIPPEKASPLACRIEHALDPDTLSRLQRFLSLPLPPLPPAP